jgi:hypothetical protein
LVKKSRYLFLLFVLLSCSIGSRKDQAGYRSLISQKNFSEAEEFINESSIKDEEKNRLLYLMEIGSLYYFQQRYSKATKIFNEANLLVDKLYTKSIKEAIASSIINDNSKTFYGSIFERSQLFQMQALSFYKLAQRGFLYEEKKIDGKSQEVRRNLSNQEIEQNLDRVRSTLIAWDSFFQEISRQSNYKSFLKNDILAKLMAGELHEALGKRRDREIALQLYKDAYKILKTFAPTQKIFNKNYKNYNKELKDYLNNKIKKPSLDKQDLTEKYSKLKFNLEHKILRLTKSVRRNQYKKIVRQLKPSEKIKKKLKDESTNVSLVIGYGLISELKGKEFSYNLRSAIDNVESPTTRNLIRGIGIPIITYFAMGPLGLGAVSRHGNVTIYSRHNAGEKLTEEVGVEFELPYAAPSKKIGSYEIEFMVKDKLIKKVELDSFTSLSDYSFINSQEMIANSFSKRASRVGTKYVAAILAAYTTYKNIKDRNGELFAKPAALAQFLISQKGIKASEKADVRHWSSLPSQYLNLETNLKPGTYTVYLNEYDPNTKQRNRRVKISDILVVDKKKNFFTHNIF